MTAFGPANLRPTAVVDQAAFGVVDPSNNLIGTPKYLWGERLAWASSLDTPNAISKRYQPSHPPSELCNFGMDFSFVIPFGVGITRGTLAIFTNQATPVPADGDWTPGPVTIRGRAVYCILTGGIAGTDYQLRWTATDSSGYVWPRTALCLCAETG